MKKNIKKKDLPKLKKEYRLKERIILINKIFWLSIAIFCLIGLLFTGIKIFYWSMENKKIDNIVFEINNAVEIKPIEDDTNNMEIINPPELPEPVAPSEKEEEVVPDDYWEYIKLPLINVNLQELKEKNKDTVAFLKVNGTNINYPVVQTKDNDYYLNHSFNKKYNSAGWVFMDYRNNAIDFQDNTIIYAHGRANSTMFGSLKNIFESNWYENTDNYVVNLVTEKESTLWQVFSIYRIPSETYYLKNSFKTDKEHQEFLDTLIGRSEYDFHTSINIDDKILTLSTCYNHTSRVVLHAKLIKKAIINID